MADSYWLAEPAPPFPAPTGGHVDVAVVGGGVTGCSCALTLAEHGVRVRIHEAREIASGASGRNGGFALRGGAMRYDNARETLGRDRAAEYWRFTEDALDRLAALAGDALERRGSLRLAADEAERDDVFAEYEALREDGFDAQWQDDPLPRFHGALRHPRDGALQPARWVRRLAARAAEAGAEIAEHTAVATRDDLDADVVVIATDGFPHRIAPQLDGAIRPTRGQVLVTEPLPERIFDRPHYSRHGYDYWHQLRDRRLVIGGRRDVALEDEFTDVEELSDPVQAALEAFVEELLGVRPVITHRWPGIWGTTRDLLPLVGTVPGSDDVWVAAGYSGHGNVLGFACGDLVAKAIVGERHPLLALFEPSRLELEVRQVG